MSKCKTKGCKQDRLLFELHCQDHVNQANTLVPQPETPSKDSQDDMELQEKLRKAHVLYVHEDGQKKPLFDHQLTRRQVAWLMQLIERHTEQARLDELENIKFIDTKTGDDNYIPFTQFRSTKDGLLMSYEDRIAQLTRNTKESE